VPRIVIEGAEGFLSIEESPELTGCVRVSLGSWRAERVAKIVHRQGTDSWVFSGASGVVAQGQVIHGVLPTDFVMFASGVEFKLVVRPVKVPEAAPVGRQADISEFCSGLARLMFARRISLLPETKKW
jgi:hypothetical protein